MVTTFEEIENACLHVVKSILYGLELNGADETGRCPIEMRVVCRTKGYGVVRAFLNDVERYRLRVKKMRQNRNQNQLRADSIRMEMALAQCSALR
jgi:hypothetical protein